VSGARLRVCRTALALESCAHDLLSRCYFFPFLRRSDRGQLTRVLRGERLHFFPRLIERFIVYPFCSGVHWYSSTQEEVLLSLRRYLCFPPFPIFEPVRECALGDPSRSLDTRWFPTVGNLHYISKIVGFFRPPPSTPPMRFFLTPNLT